MLGSRIEELLASEIDANANAATTAGSAAANANVGGFSIIADESRQRQLLLEDEEEDFMDEGTCVRRLLLPKHHLASLDINYREQRKVPIYQ